MSFIVTLLVIQMIPVEGLFISQYKMLETLDLLNTVVGLTLVYVAPCCPSRSGRCAASSPGCRRAGGGRDDRRLLAHAGVLPRSRFPLLAPGLVATGVFGFIQAWNEFTLALVVMTREDQRTLPLWLRDASPTSTAAPTGAAIMAGSTLIAVPVIIFFLVVQGRMASGLTSGAVKG